MQSRDRIHTDEFKRFLTIQPIITFLVVLYHQVICLHGEHRWTGFPPGPTMLVNFNLAMDYWILYTWAHRVCRCDAGGRSCACSSPDAGFFYSGPSKNLSGGTPPSLAPKILIKLSLDYLDGDPWVTLHRAAEGNPDMERAVIKEFWYLLLSGVACYNC